LSGEIGSMLSPTYTSSILKKTDVVDPQETSLDFSSLVPKFSPKAIAEADSTLTNHALAKSELDKTIQELNDVNWFKKILNPNLYFFTKEIDLRKDVLHIQLKSTVEKSNEAKLSLEQAQKKSLDLKAELEQIKEQLDTLYQIREEAPAKIILLQEKINQNLSDIKTIEPILGPAFGKIYYSMLAASAIDPDLIKQAFDPKQQSIEYLILNRDKHINHTELFIKASQLTQPSSTLNNILKQNLSEKLSKYESIKKIHDAFKTSLPADLMKLTPEQINQAAKLGEELKKSINEYDALKKQMSHQLEQAKEYIKYHDTWSKLTQEEIETAKLITNKKLENTEANKIIDDFMREIASQKENLLIEKQLLIEVEINAQEKIILDNQLLLKTQQDFSNYFQAEAKKLEASPINSIETDNQSEIHVDVSSKPLTNMISISPGHIPEISHFDI
jgi:hypothetical protein